MDQKILLHGIDQELNTTVIPSIYIIEGFDITGKSEIISKICDKNPLHVCWEPRYDKELKKDVLPYSDRYALGLALIDLIKNGIVNTDAMTIVISRGLPSSLVYNYIYFQEIDHFSTDDFMNYAKTMYSDPHMIHTIYVQHDDKDYAKLMYEASLKRDYSELYDKFESFDDYWDIYEAFDAMYMDYLNKICGNNYTIVHPERR